MEVSMARISSGLPALAAVVLAMAGCSDFLGSGGDDGPPEIEWITPTDGETGVSVLGSVRVRFSNRLAAATLASGVRLRSGGREVVTEMWLTEGRILDIVPTDPLDFGTVYHVEVTSDVTAAGGTPLSRDTALTFSTRGAPPPYPDQDSLRVHLEVLAHDSMRGRGSGSEDELRAAEYLVERFAAYGLEPASSGMIQAFQARSRRGDTLLSSRNVLAALPGDGDLAGEWLVVGAHYDHIGFRGLENEIGGPNNGADDNASGTALLLELARALRTYVDGNGMADTPRRSVLFAGFGAEEEGLLGSCYYVFGDPVAPLGATRGMMNLDMVGRLRGNELVVSGQETADGWPALLSNANAPGLYLVRPPSSAPGNSDHACFWQAGIPWVGFFTGFHGEYHAQDDDVALIDFDGMGRVGDLGIRVLTRLMVDPEPPAFTGSIPSLSPGPG
jgi:hypothetical protein